MSYETERMLRETDRIIHIRNNALLMGCSESVFKDDWHERFEQRQHMKQLANEQRLDREASSNGGHGFAQYVAEHNREMARNPPKTVNLHGHTYVLKE